MHCISNGQCWSKAQEGAWGRVHLSPLAHPPLPAHLLYLLQAWSWEDHLFSNKQQIFQEERYQRLTNLSPCPLTPPPTEACCDHGKCTVCYLHTPIHTHSETEVVHKREHYSRDTVYPLRMKLPDLTIQVLSLGRSLYKIYEANEESVLYHSPCVVLGKSFDYAALTLLLLPHTKKHKNRRWT